MTRTKDRRRLALVLVLMMIVNTCLGFINPSMTSFAYTERTASVNASSLNVRSGPGTGNSIVAKLSQGTSVTVIGESNGTDGKLWYQIRFSGTGGAETTGYALKDYIKFPVAYTGNNDFEAYLTSQGFPESYKVRLRELHAQYPNWVFRAQHTNLDWNTVIKEESVVGRNLVHGNSISSWKSIAQGAYNWDTSSWPTFDSGSWVAASEDILRYYMDPRNFLGDTTVFQFLTQSYDANSHTAEGLKTMIKGTFLEGSAPGGGSSPNGGTGTDSPGGGETNTGGPGVVDQQPGTSNNGVDSSAPTSGSHSGVSLEGPQASITRNVTDVLTTSGYGPGMTNSPPSDNTGSSTPTTGSVSYVDIIMNAAAQSGVNPYVLAAMILQEQGSDGSGNSISGTQSGYQGFYNFFNIEAYRTSSMGAVERGLWYASQSGNYDRPWNTAERSILGGAAYYGNNYVRVGQDTFYLKKFNVQGSNMYKHQYMTNIQGAASEGIEYAKAYNDEMKQTALEFKIPVFTGMPDNPAGKPTTDGSPNNKLSNLYVDGFGLTPTFNKDTQEYDLIVDPSVVSVTIGAIALDSTATVSGAGSMQLQSGNNEIKISVKAQNGTIREYILHVVRQNNGPTYSGSNNNNNNPSNTGPGDNSGPGGSGGPGVDNQPTEGTPGGSNVVVSPMGTANPGNLINQ